jgi:hypothetical protein
LAVPAARRDHPQVGTDTVLDLVRAGHATTAAAVYWGTCPDCATEHTSNCSASSEGKR